MGYEYILLFILFVLFIIIISLAIYYILYNSFDTINTNGNIHYMSAEETSKFLKEDRDNYISNLSTYDLYARNTPSAKKYIEEIQNLASTFTDKDIELLNNCTSIADDLLRNIKRGDINDIVYAKFINFKDIANIKWVFSKTDSDSEGETCYENGLPHTRKDIIFLSDKVLINDEDELIKILIHEKIHIYQRNNSELFKSIIINMGYIEVTDDMIRGNSELIKQIKYRRSNPDINKKLYKNTSTNKILICFYKSDKPSSISDVTGNYYDEHPYETIAYELSEYIYKKNKIEKYKNI
jgi:hypothetical protein